MLLDPVSAGSIDDLLDLFGDLDHLSGHIHPQLLLPVQFECHLRRKLVGSVLKTFKVLVDLLAFLSVL